MIYFFVGVAAFLVGTLFGSYLMYEEDYEEEEEANDYDDGSDE